MTTLVTAKTTYAYNEDMTIEQAKEKVAKFKQMIKWYADDAQNSYLDELDYEDYVHVVVNNKDFNVIYELLDNNGAVFCS